MKKAICFGTNYVGTNNQLSWCVKDAQDWANFLRGFGFTIREFFESEVNRISFLYNLRELVINSVPGDVIVCTHSGHGSRKYNHAEVDFYDEVLYFTDGVVYDDEVRAILDLLPDGVVMFLFFDTCHSGGMMRLYEIGGSQAKIKYVQPDFIIRGAQRRKSMVPELPGKEIYISGCESEEYSYDAGDLHNGAATYYALHSYKNCSTYAQWHQNILKYLPSSDYPQTPVLSATENNANKIVFEACSDPVDELSPSWWTKIWLWIKKVLKTFISWN